MRRAIAVLVLAGAAAAQGTLIPLPAFTSSYIASTATRGFYFQTPIPMVIVGLRVPDEGAQGVQCVEVTRMSVAPPAYPATGQGVQAFYANNVPSNQIIPCSIPFNSGEFIGVLGACGTSTLYNSYSQPGPFSTTMLGQPIAINRFLTQTNLSTTGGNQPYSSEPAGTISRVEVYVAPAGGYASFTSYGAGCPARSAAAVYELFTSATFDLSNSSLLFIPGGNGSYTIVPGPNLWFSGFSNNLALGDDQCATVTMPFSFPHAGGSTSVISPSSNGFVWLGSNANSACCTGDNVAFLSDPMARIAPCWMDLYPPGNLAGGVYADLDPTTGDYVITWNAVPEYSTGPNVTMQVALQASGIFEIRYQTVANMSHQALAGYSMGAVPVDPGSSDLSTVVTTPITTAGSASPLTLTASARPVLGTSFNLLTGSIAGGSTFGVNSLGVQQINPGFDLTPFGAPGCSQYVNSTLNSIFVVGGTTASMAITVPNNTGLVGLHVYSQSLTLSAGVNALGVAFSNGLDLLIDAL